ncbi:MAG: phosphatidylglycerophosphatase A [Thermodesulfobacteriota bacterium]
MRGTCRQPGGFEKAVLALSTWFGMGCLPGLPGTYATVAGSPLVWLMDRMGSFPGALFLAAFLALAFWSADRGGKMAGEEDPREVVVDEVAGFLVALFLVPLSWLNLSLGFVLFRVFDIWKPFPLRRAEKLGGGLGIVMDDILAGVYANVCLRLIRWGLG